MQSTESMQLSSTNSALYSLREYALEFALVVVAGNSNNVLGTEFGSEDNCWTGGTENPALRAAREGAKINT